MLCCRKRPPSPNEIEQRKSPPKEDLEANAQKNKSKTPPPSAAAVSAAAGKPTNGRTIANSETSPESILLEEKTIKAEAVVPSKKSPGKEPSPPKGPQKSKPSPNKRSPEKAPSPPKSPQKAPSPAKESPKKKASSPVRESSPKKAASPTRKSPEKGKSPPRQVVTASPPIKAGSPDRFSTASISEYLQRLETTTDLDILVAEGKTLLAEAKAKQAAGGHNAKMSADLSNLIARLEAVTTRLESVSNKGGASEESQAAAVQAFDDVVNGSFGEFFALSNKIGGVVATQGGMVKDAINCEREFLVVASKSKEPNSATLQKLLTPMSQKISAIQEFREQNRANKEFFNHLSVLSEAIGALGWVAVTPAPAPYVKEMIDAGQFYSNRVLRDYKEKDKTHVEWVRAWTKALTELQAFVKQHHTTGVVWNKQGVDATTLAGGAAPPPPAAGGPPPPPPPGPPPPPFVDDGAPAKQDDTASSRSALFASLNKGTAITSGLRKVKDDEKTHKNVALRLQSPVPYKAVSSSPKSAPKAPAKLPDKPPKTELEGKKWIVEYHKDNKNIVLDDVNMKQQIYVFRCTNSTIQVKGKVNSIVLDNCKKTAVVFETVVAAIETVNCQSIQCQVQGHVPTVSVDKTDGFQIYLNEKSLDAEIVTAKSSELNILVPQSNGEFKEFALPEQFKSKWSGSGFKTETTDINA